MAIVKIPVAVVNKIAMVDCGTAAVADNNNYVLEVTFDAEWEEYTTKTARFVCGAWVSEKAFTGNTVEMPMLPPDYTHVRVGFYAGDISTTSPAKIAIVGSIMSNAPSEIEAAEIERVRAEAERAEAEAERVANESDRITAEQERVDNELARQAAEDERIANELIRIANEQERIAHGTVFIADYGVTTFAEIQSALEESKAVICRLYLRMPFGRERTYAEGVLRNTTVWQQTSDAFAFDCYPYEFRVDTNNNWTTVSMLDNAPTEGSSKLVTSGSIYNALQSVTGAFWADYGVTTFAEVRAAIAAQKPVFVVHNYDFYRLESAADEDFVFTSIDSKGIRLSPYDVWSEFVAADIVPTEDSMRLITSGGVFNGLNDALSRYYTKTETNTLLDDKQDVLTFDDEPIEGSTNPVTSDGIYTALQNMDFDIIDTTLTQAGKAADAEVVGIKFNEITDEAFVFDYTIPDADITFWPDKNITSRRDMVDAPNYYCRSFRVPATGWYRFITPRFYAQEAYYIYSSDEFIRANYLRSFARRDLPEDGGIILNEGEYVVGRIYNNTSTEYNYTAEYTVAPTVVLEPTLPLTPKMTQEVLDLIDFDVDDYYTKAETDTLLAAKQNTLTWDTAPTAGSANPVTSGGISAALGTKQNVLTFDTAPTAGSLNPATSNGIYSALGTKVDKVLGKGLSTNDYTNIDKAKVDAMPTATSDLTNDSDYQNSAEVNDAIAAALGSMTSLQYEIVTELPTTGAAGTVYLMQNGLNSYDQYMWIGGQYYNLGSTAIDLSNYYTMAQVDTRLAAKQDALNFDAVPTVLSTNPVTSGGVFNALQDKQDVLTFDNAPALNSANPVTSEGLYLALQGKQNTLTFDGVPTALSPNPVTSAGLYTALEGKQAALTFDEQPIVNSRNPVTSSGIYAALLEKENRLTWDLTPTANSGNPVTSGGVYAALHGADIQQIINDAIGNITGFTALPVAALPAVGEVGIVYMVPSPLHPDKTDEYVWVETPEGHYEAIGTTDIDLDNYYTKTETDALIDEVRIFEAQINVTSAADIIQSVNDRKSIVVHAGAGSPSEFAVKAAISGEKVYLYTMTLNVGSPRSYPVFTRHVIEGTTWAVKNVGGAVTDDVPFIAEEGRTTPPQIEAATAKNRIIVVKSTGGAYYPCINVSTTADYRTHLLCLAGSYDAATTTFGLRLLVYEVRGSIWGVAETYIVTITDLQDAVDALNDRIDEVEATIGRFRGNYGSYALLAADSRSHRENDYAIVTVDETHAGGCWYYTFNGEYWVGRFKIRDAAFTSAQMDAINSGATTAKIDSIANKLDKVTTSGKTEVYIHNGATQTVRGISTSITSASGDAAKIPTVAAVYNNRRVNGVAADAGSTALDFDALLAKCGLNNLGAGHAWAYCRNFNSCTDRPFNSDAVYIELWGRDSSTFIVHVIDWIAQRDAWRTKNNGIWGSWSLINNRASGNSAVAYTNVSSNFSTLEDYTGVTRQAWRNGSGAGVAFHLKCKCTTACNNDWYYIGTVAEHFRPMSRVSINCTLWSMGEGSMSIGGDINTDGRIRVWINTLATNTNVQFRVNASWMIN